MIDDRLRTAAGHVRADLDGPIPEFVPPSRSRRGVGLPAAALVVAGLGGLWAIGTGDHTSRPDEPAAATAPVTEPVAPVGEPVTEPAPAVTDAAVPPMERVLEDELLAFAGTYTIDYQPATVVLGSTGTVEYTLDMTESSFCLRSQGGSGCESTGDTTPLPETPRGLDLGGSRSNDGTWARTAIAADGVEVQFYDEHGPACDMHQFSLAPYSTASLWACEGTQATPEDVPDWFNAFSDVAITKDGRTLVATVSRPTLAALPIADPVTTTGFHIGDPAPATDPATTSADLGPWLLVADSTDRIVGYVLTNDYATPPFDGIVLVKDELGARIGHVGSDGWHLVTVPRLDR